MKRKVYLWGKVFIVFSMVLCLGCSSCGEKKTLTAEEMRKISVAYQDTCHQLSEQLYTLNILVTTTNGAFNGDVDESIRNYQRYKQGLQTLLKVVKGINLQEPPPDIFFVIAVNEYNWYSRFGSVEDGVSYGSYSDDTYGDIRILLKLPWNGTVPAYRKFILRWLGLKENHQSD
jgi:hypothetical protein